jgi:REP element-mobilizing transposase RayT
MIALRNPYAYRRRLPHFQKTAHPLFVTFRELNQPPLPPEARDIVLPRCLHDQGKKIIPHAAVVMPEHVHLLLTSLLNSDGRPFSLAEILQVIKGASARRVNRLLHAEGPLWQEESFDHVLRSDESFADKVEYIRQNPVHRGLARTPEEYPWLWLEP